MPAVAWVGGQPLEVVAVVPGRGEPAEVRVGQGEKAVVAAAGAKQMRVTTTGSIPETGYALNAWNSRTRAVQVATKTAPASRLK
jgi:hypothetical protein